MELAIARRAPATNGEVRPAATAWAAPLVLVAVQTCHERIKVAALVYPGAWAQGYMPQTPIVDDSQRKPLRGAVPAGAQVDA